MSDSNQSSAALVQPSNKLVLFITIGIVLGALIGHFLPSLGQSVSIFGTLFVQALKSVAPVLVFILVLSSIANQAKASLGTMRPVLVLYAIGSFTAAAVAVGVSFAFPVEITLNLENTSDLQPPQSISAVFITLLMKIVQNPFTAIIEANYISLLAWAIALGIVFQNAAETTKTTLQDWNTAVITIVRWVIMCAPIGIFGLVANTISETGFDGLKSYGQLLGLLLGSMAIIALVVNPLLVFIKIRQNPYPLVFKCLVNSGVTAFFTRSSAANIPVNMNLCKTLGLDKDSYSISIPLGATINMAGAAITITVLTLAAVNTLGIEVSIFQALLLSIVAAASACGASGVAGGSLLLIPLACSLFGISDAVAGQVMAVGFVISVVQDSAETALNSSTDVVFTAAAEGRGLRQDKYKGLDFSR